MRRFALLSLLTLAACDTVGNGPPSIASVDPDGGVEVASAEALQDYADAWAAADVDEYLLRYEVICYCAPLVYDLHVADGQIVAVWINGEPAPEEEPLLVFAIDGLYAEAMRGFEEADAITVRVQPDSPPLPVSISIDYAFELADEEMTYRILGFEPIRR